MHYLLIDKTLFKCYNYSIYHFIWILLEKGGRPVINKEECSRIISQYYKEIYNYCYSRLSFDKQSAEDCAQEVFVTFFSKGEKLSDEAIRLWLYRTADNIIKAYLRSRDQNTVSLEDSPEAENIAADSPFPDENESLLDILSDEEMNILRVYYDSAYGDKKAAAKSLGLSLPALYQRIHKIKLKLKSGQDK